ncbi:MAG: hypothetical protein M1833_004967 [Piccolia ochrophora]|nr:MAG: hypothetical protein M1833_004967 [Piccolia ochrophora]
MKLTLQDRLLRRELGGTSRYSAIQGFYGDKAWVDDLDIVNELGGHSGCVNALSWSRSGRLLASGSDDQHINIHAYLPDSSTNPFSLTTSISTGHSANIFSVKFMPHSNDGTLVSCAGDGEVRIFDIEHSGRSTIHSGASPSGRTRGLNTVYNGVRYLSDADTSGRVYRSHADRVKRVVTESSPHLFLTCSEDGEVRQWDLRQPSSAYPSPRGGRGFLGARESRENEHSRVPPPLISYKKFNLDLNTISCSPSQPHYIALGGAHLHCFLHDRRMLGRDVQSERGTPTSNLRSDRQDELMSQATRCVRKFAPNGAKKMKRTDNGHITACKISDANPNEMIVSWSGEWIYSFDLMRSPDAADTEESSQAQMDMSHKRTKESRDRKRKREKAGSTSSQGEGRGGSKPRQDTGENNAEGDLALRVRYENGQSEEIPIEAPRSGISGRSNPMSEAREAVLTEPQRKSHRIAHAVVHLRKQLFGLEASNRTSNASHSEQDLTNHTPSFTSALGFAATYLPSMDEIMRSWRYPVNPVEEDVIFQQTLRRNREAARRFVQAAGTLARVLGGKLRTGGRSESPAINYFKQVVPAPNEGNTIDGHAQFGYDFIRAILAWLEEGPNGVLQAFKPSPDRRRDSPRFPIPEDAGSGAIDDLLIPYLIRLASNRSIPNVDASRFERDESRLAFETETAAVIAFGNAIKIPLEDLSRAVTATSSNCEDERTRVDVQDRGAALRFWGLKVGRGLLMNIGEPVNFAFVDRAFGGLGIAARVDEGRSQEDIDVNEEELVVQGVGVVRRGSQARSRRSSGAGTTDTADSHGVTSAEVGADGGPGVSQPVPLATVEDADSDDEMILIDDLHDEIAHRLHSDSEEEEEDGSEDENDDDDDDDPNEDLTSEERQFMWTSAFDRSRMREKVEQDVPSSAHTRQYRGHCNIKTVKDVNFFGMQDDYVVSGSDNGHLFIWDKKSTQLVNILEGDGEVVNVVQGHPYEPVLAVSGIDHTIKIFSPDARLQADARAGVNVSTSTSSGFSTLELGGRTRLGRNRPRRPSRPPAAPSEDDEDQETPTNGGLASCRRMHQSYEITSQNDVDRQGGQRDAYVTRGMLAQLAARLRHRQMHEGAGGEVEGVVMDDNCSIGAADLASRVPWELDAILAFAAESTYGTVGVNDMT